MGHEDLWDSRMPVTWFLLGVFFFLFPKETYRLKFLVKLFSRLCFSFVRSGINTVVLSISSGARLPSAQIPAFRYYSVD